MTADCYTGFSKMENREKEKKKKERKNNHFSNMVKSFG